MSDNYTAAIRGAGSIHVYNFSGPNIASNRTDTSGRYTSSLQPGTSDMSATSSKINVTSGNVRYSTSITSTISTSST